MIGKISQKYLYGPNDLKNRVCIVNSQTKSIGERDFYRQQQGVTNIYKVRLSLRNLANYKFIFYFLFSLLIIKTLSGYSFIATFILVSFVFLILNLFK